MFDDSTIRLKVPPLLFFSGYILITVLIPAARNNSLTSIVTRVTIWQRSIQMTQRGLGKGLGALLSIFDEEEAAIEARKSTIGDEGTAGDGKAPIEELFAMPAKSKTPTTTEAPASAKPVGISVPVAKSTMAEPFEIDINSIDSNLGQPRKEFDPDKLQELADSIRSSGIINPIILVPMGARFMIVAGERRWRAAKIAGLRKVPAIVRNFSPEQIAEVAIVENLQRQDLNEIELARGIDKLIREFKLTQEQAAIRIGKSRTAVAHTLRLLSLPSEVITLVEQGKLSAGHARCLVSISNKEQSIKLARQCVTNNLSVRELERILQAKSPNPADLVQKFKPQQSLELKELTRKLTALFLTKVSINGTNQKGRITIDYFTPQDLVRIRKHIIDVNDLVSVDETLKKKLGVK
jgi:ParB family chromosome partitioning protein